MIFRDYNNVNDFIRLEGNTPVKLEAYTGPFGGYFQHHAVGLVLFGLPPVYFFQVGPQKFDPSQIRQVRYRASGNAREVDIIGVDGKTMTPFAYQEFWIDEADLIEFALELPHDIERDLLKFISENIC